MVSLRVCASAPVALGLEAGRGKDLAAAAADEDECAPAGKVVAQEPRAHALLDDEIKEAGNGDLPGIVPVSKAAARGVRLLGHHVEAGEPRGVVARAEHAGRQTAQQGAVLELPLRLGNVAAGVVLLLVRVRGVHLGPLLQEAWRR